MDETKIARSEDGSLPSELWVKVLSFLHHADIARASSTCQTLHRVKNEAFRAACYRQWPSWAAIAENPDAQWLSVYERLELRENESGTLQDAQSLWKYQPVIVEGHRSILAEWLIEVSFEWELDSPIVFEAVKYLDYYLSKVTVPRLARLQLVGLGCLRLAMLDAHACAPSPSPFPPDTLDPKHFAYVSDDTYTVQEIITQTQEIQSVIPTAMATHPYPNARRHLRSCWYHAIATGVLSSEEFHIYDLASFLLHLSLLDSTFSTVPPSLLAAAALSLSLSACHYPAWPRAMEYHECYISSDLDRVCGLLASAQANQQCSQLRGWWLRYSGDGRAMGRGGVAHQDRQGEGEGEVEEVEEAFEEEEGEQYHQCQPRRHHRSWVVPVFSQPSACLYTALNIKNKGSPPTCTATHNQGAGAEMKRETRATTPKNAAATNTASRMSPSVTQCHNTTSDDDDMSGGDEKFITLSTPEVSSEAVLPSLASS